MQDQQYKISSFASGDHPGNPSDVMITGAQHPLPVWRRARHSVEFTFKPGRADEEAVAGNDGGRGHPEQHRDPDGRDRVRPGHRSRAAGTPPLRARRARRAGRGPPGRDHRPDGRRRHLPDAQAAPPPGDPRPQDCQRPCGDRRDGDRRTRADRRRDRGRLRPHHRHHHRDRGHPGAAALLLHLQDPVRRGGRLLPPALPAVREAEPRPPRREHRPDGPSGAAHRRPGEDRDVHRAAPAARRRPHHDHHPLPERRDPPLQGDAGQCGLAAPPEDRRDRPARPGPGRRARRLRRGRRPAGHPDQQRRADRAALAEGVQRAGRRRVGPAARR